MSFCMGQPPMDVKVVPQPYDISFYNGNSSTRSVKSNTAVAEYKRNAYRKDTLFAKQYDTDGNLIVSQVYANGKKSTVTQYSYDAAKRWVRWQQPDSRSTHINTTFYGPLGNMLYFEDLNISKSDTIRPRITTKFAYDSNGKLTGREQVFDGSILVKNSYRYENGDMVLAEFKKTNEPLYYQQVKFIYDKNHQPLQQIQYFYRANKTDTVILGSYTYSNGKLASEENQDGSNPRRKILTTYVYDDGGRLSSMVTKNDTLYRNISCEYTGDRVSKILIKSNTWRTLGPGPLIVEANPLISLPLTYIITYTYDSKGNLIKDEQALNGEVQVKKTYNIQYY